MTNLKNKKFKQLVLAATIAAMTSVISVAQAAEVPKVAKQVVLNAREQPIDLFLSELFGKIGVPVEVDDSIIGSVNGDFRKSAGQVIKEISAAFQLSVYYDGAVAYVYPSNEIERKMMYMSDGAALSVINTASQMGLTDSRNTIKSTDVGLLVTGASRFVAQVDSLSAGIAKRQPTKTSVAKPVVEAADDYTDVQIFKLKYAWADDVSLVIGGETVVVPGVASLIQQLIQPGALPGTTSSRTPASTSLDGLRGQGLSGRGLQEVSNSSATGNDNPLPIIRGTTGGGTAGTAIVADPLTNSVIIRDRAERMASYESLIKELDKEPQMVEIEATIIDLDTDKLRELGINWRLSEGNSDILLGNGTASDELLLPNAGVVTPSGAGGIVSLVLGSRQAFISRIRALETQGAARIVSKPHVMTLSNVEALLDTTSTFFVRVEGQEEVDLFDVKVGTRLRVTPHVYERGSRRQIKLRVNITDGSTTDQSVDSIPIIDESNINTQAIVDVGQSLLIGGLVREIKSNGVQRVPVLGRLPVLGGLFRTQIKSNTRQERMFLITPRINTRHVAGKRFVAPVHSGTQGEIIQSAPTRLQETNQALNLLDEAYPVEQYLPKGEGLETPAKSYAQPYQTLDPVGGQIPQSDLHVQQDNDNSLRNRLRPKKLPDVAAVRREPLPEFVELPASQVAGDANESSGQYGWQTLVPSANSVRTGAQPGGNDIQPAIGDDNLIWQEVK